MKQVKVSLAIAALALSLAPPAASAAERIVTETREKVCLNGLWSFAVDSSPSPTGGVFTVAAAASRIKLPSTADPRCLVAYGPNGEDVSRKAFGGRGGEVAWFARKVTVGESWRNRKIVIGVEWVNAAALAYVDGELRGEFVFPGGAIELEDGLEPGEHEIALHVFSTVPAEMAALFKDRDAIEPYAKGRRGRAYASGDVWIAAEDRTACIGDVLAIPSVTKGRLDFSVGVARPRELANRRLRLRADVYASGDDARKAVVSFESAEISEGADRITFGGEWRCPRLWTPDDPTSTYFVAVSALDGDRVVDAAYPEEFGFREVCVRGRELLFNGHPFHYRPVQTTLADSAAYSAEEVRETCRRLKAQGFNSLFSTANYGFTPGMMPTVEFMLREASKEGMCATIALPEPKDFVSLWMPSNWVFTASFRRMQEAVIRRLQNIPGLILWTGTMNHGYFRGASDPLAITGRREDIPADWDFDKAATFAIASDGVNSMSNSIATIRREKMKLQNEFISKCDPSREVYNHAAGPFGKFYAHNCYLDFAPEQERSDWYEHWQTNGVAPLMITEYGAPHQGSWANFRGGPGEKIHMLGDRTQTKQCWMNEFNAQFLGERAFATSAAKRRLMDCELRYLKGNRPVFYYDYNHGPTVTLMKEDDVHEVVAGYLRRNLRDFRARGVTSVLVWDLNRMDYFTNAPALPRKREVREGALEGIDSFGVVKSDFIRPLPDRVNMMPRASGRAVIEASSPLLGWIAGFGADFTMVDCVYREGERVRKSLVVLNDTFSEKTISWRWSCGAAQASGKVALAPGGRADIPVEFTLPATGAAEARTEQIRAAFEAEGGEWSSEDSFEIKVLGSTKFVQRRDFALYDPKGESRGLVDAIGVKCRDFGGEAANGGVIVVGRNALDAKSALSTLNSLAAKCHTLVVLEQSAETMAALGFRINEYGLRKLFDASGDFDDALLHDWRGSSTMLPWFLGGRRIGGYAHWNWHGFNNSRCWRAGNRGTVNSVLIERPTRGDFATLVKGGFDLQYAGVLEYRHGRRRIIFSQLDASSRTVERCPAAEETLSKVFDLAQRGDARARPLRRVRVFEWQRELRGELESLGIACETLDEAASTPTEDILVVGPGANLDETRCFLARGGTVLALGLTGDEASAIVPGTDVRNATTNSYPAICAALGTEPLFAGISNADLQWRYPDDVAFLARFGDDLLHVERLTGGGTIVFAAPVSWNFDAGELAQRVNRRRAQGLVTRLVANLGGETPDVFSSPTPRLYADEPIAEDDPYRYFQW